LIGTPFAALKEKNPPQNGGFTMTLPDNRDRILQILSEIAPEAEIANLQDDLPFRKQFTFDSVDFLNFATGLQERFQIRIPERDYPELSTINGCLNYIAKRIPSD
jgi:acyl carrier protein